ncbi:DUF3850 domain-containing protein [Lactococcus lactis]|uniref:DUF3850 domain-containing protein n=1 Tax=Lactococcus lactis TaxID=1358 RepID=A0A9X4NJD9_9LACT|nr:DUF3850 domain-containing protein [Lactococcus lactis]MDG4985166.1 DUF3850 domain-containing protein [Lactococcus lactis]
MKTHDLKLDIKYFEDVKSGKKNFEIRKNDRDFQVGDILELKAFKNGYYAKRNSGSGFGDDYHVMDPDGCLYSPEQADTIKVKILNVISADEYNNFQESVNGIPQSIKWANSYQETYIRTINEVLEDFFVTDRLPDGCVILGIEVVK